MYSFVNLFLLSSLLSFFLLSLFRILVVTRMNTLALHSRRGTHSTPQRLRPYNEHTSGPSDNRPSIPPFHLHPPLLSPCSPFLAPSSPPASPCPAISICYSLLANNKEFYLIFWLYKKEEEKLTMTIFSKIDFSLSFTFFGNDIHL